MADMNGDRELSLEEILSVKHQNSIGNIAAIRERVFSAIDDNGDGFISWYEIENVLTSHDVKEDTVNQVKHSILGGGISLVSAFVNFNEDIDLNEQFIHGIQYAVIEEAGERRLEKLGLQTDYNIKANSCKLARERALAVFSDDQALKRYSLKTTRDFIEDVTLKKVTFWEQKKVMVNGRYSEVSTYKYVGPGAMPDCVIEVAIKAAKAYDWYVWEKDQRYTESQMKRTYDWARDEAKQFTRHALNRLKNDLLPQNMTHPNIVKILGSSVVDDPSVKEADWGAGNLYLKFKSRKQLTTKTYVVTEILGKNLLELTDEVGFDESGVAFIVEQMLKAISYAHAENESAKKESVYHRDIRLENVLYVYPEGTGIGGHKAANMQYPLVKLIDFGAATKKKTTMKIPGKLLYMAPEVVRRQNDKLDEWAIGILLLRLLNGCYPFSKKRTAELENFESSRTTVAQPSDIMYSASKEVKLDEGQTIEAETYASRLLVEYDERPSAEKMLNDPWIVRHRSERALGYWSGLVGSLASHGVYDGESFLRQTLRFFVALNTDLDKDPVFHRDLVFFRDADADNDQIITSTEVKELWKKEDVHRLVGDNFAKILTIADMNDDKGLSFAELVSFSGSLDPSQHDRIRKRVLNELDSDGDKKISWKEVSSELTRLHCGGKSGMIQKIGASIDEKDIDASVQSVFSLTYPEQSPSVEKGGPEGRDSSQTEEENVVEEVRLEESSRIKKSSCEARRQSELAIFKVEANIKNVESGDNEFGWEKGEVLQSQEGSDEHVTRYVHKTSTSECEIAVVIKYKYRNWGGSISKTFVEDSFKSLLQHEQVRGLQKQFEDGVIGRNILPKKLLNHPNIVQVLNISIIHKHVTEHTPELDSKTKISEAYIVTESLGVNLADVVDDIYGGNTGVLTEGAIAFIILQVLYAVAYYVFLVKL